MLVDESGRRESYGTLVRRRVVGGYLVELADDAARGMWWVIAVRTDLPRHVIMGFRRERRLDAGRTFRGVTEVELEG